MSNATSPNAKTTLVVTAMPNPNETEATQQYLQGVLPLLMGAGGRPVKRLKVDNVIHGNPSGMVLVMDFDSPDTIRGMFESKDYAALMPAREKGFTEMNILLTETM
mgnify:FL=1